MNAFANNYKFKTGVLYDYSSSYIICINRYIFGNTAWFLVNTKSVNSSFNLPLKLQNFSGNNLLDVSSFAVNENTISMVPYETLVFK